MTMMTPSKTTRTYRTGRTKPALSMDFVVTDDQLLRQSTEEIADWVRKAALRVLQGHKSNLILSGLDTGNEA